MPVLSRPKAKPARAKVAASPTDGASPTRPAATVSSPIWMTPRRKVPVVMTTAAASIRSPAAVTMPATRPVPVEHQILDRRLGDIEPFGLREECLHGGAVELAVGLGARTPHRRALGAVEHAELDAGAVGGAANDAVERVDLAHQMALGEAANGGVARHLADRRAAMGHQQRGGAEPRGGGAASQPACPPPITITS